MLKMIKKETALDCFSFIRAYIVTNTKKSRKLVNIRAFHVLSQITNTYIYCLIPGSPFRDSKFLTLNIRDFAFFVFERT